MARAHMCINAHYFYFGNAFAGIPFRATKKKNLRVKNVWFLVNGRKKEEISKNMFAFTRPISPFGDEKEHFTLTLGNEDSTKKKKLETTQIELQSIYMYIYIDHT